MLFDVPSQHQHPLIFARPQQKKLPELPVCLSDLWMRAIYRLVVVALLAFMLRSPLLRLQQTALHLSKSLPLSLQRYRPVPIVSSNTSTTRTNQTMSRPSGLIANKGLELLTFGTPNGTCSSPSKLLSAPR